MMRDKNDERRVEDYIADFAAWMDDLAEQHRKLDANDMSRLAQSAADNAYVFLDAWVAQRWSTLPFHKLR